MTVLRRALGDLDVAFRDVGSGDVLVLVHGITGSMRNWALVAPALASGRRVISYDQRGHGLSSDPTPPDDYTLDLLADDLRRLLDGLGVQRFALVGHSMGAMVAQTFVLAHPERVDRLVLIGATAGPVDDFERTVLADAAKAVVRDGIAAAWPLHRQLWPPWQEQMLAADSERLERAREEFTRTSAAGYAGFAHSAVTRLDLREHLGDIGCPTLVIVGEHDERRLATTQVIVDRVIGAREVVVPGAGHTPQIENPERFLAELEGFLSAS
jgi:pimeloyl-ACP methyl ester carboxylesterase